MRKTFPLRPEGKNPDRVLEALKHELRKYLKRERGRPLPEGADYLDFDCRFGLAADSAAVVHVAGLTKALDEAFQSGAIQCYVEILARPAQRRTRDQSAGQVLSSNLDAEDDSED